MGGFTLLLEPLQRGVIVLTWPQSTPLNFAMTDVKGLTNSFSYLRFSNIANVEDQKI